MIQGITLDQLVRPNKELECILRDIVCKYACSDDVERIIQILLGNSSFVSHLTNLVLTEIDLTEIIQTIINDQAFINNIINSTTIINDVSNNQTLINNISNNPTLIDNIINNETVINNITSQVISELNIEVEDINGKSLFFAFRPTGLPTIEDAILEEIDNPTYFPNCELPNAFLVSGNLRPFINTTETYSLTHLTGENLYYIWSVVGGTIVGSNTGQTVTVAWGDLSSLASITGAVFCIEDEVLYNFNFFTLERPEDALQMEGLCRCKIFRIENNGSTNIVFKYKDCLTQEPMVETVSAGSFVQACSFSSDRFLENTTDLKINTFPNINIVDTLNRCC
jgi:hypothetical protein